jgi:polar amino acid transport system substrate-binding protein
MLARIQTFDRVLFSICLVALCLVLASCGGSDNRSGPRSLEDIREAGVLRAGVNPNFPPMSVYGRTNQLEGFDVDIATQVAKELGVELQLVPTEAAQRVPFLTSNRIDMTLGALTMTPERAEVVDFTIPIHTEAMSVLTTDKIDADTWRALDDPDVTLVNMRGNRSVSILDEELPKARKLLVDANADTVRAIAQGRADAMIENVDFFMGFTKNYPNVNWRIIDDRLFVAQAGIGVAKGNDSLRTELNNIVAELHASGFIEERWQHWYGAPMSAPVDLDYSI